MSYLPYLCLRIVVSNTYCVVCVFYFFFFSVCFVFIFRLVYVMLSVSLNCPFMIAPSSSVLCT